MNSQVLTEVRLDKWLWAARIFKTRQTAAKAITGGHVELNGNRAKPARTVHVGDELIVRKGPYTYALTIQHLAQQRGPARVAQTLYMESGDSVRERARLAQDLKTRAAQVLYDSKKPTKQDRRQARLKKREQI